MSISSAAEDQAITVYFISTVLSGCRLISRIKVKVQERVTISKQRFPLKMFFFFKDKDSLVALVGLILAMYTKSVSNTEKFTHTPLGFLTAGTKGMYFHA